MKKTTNQLRQVLRQVINNPRNNEIVKEKAREALEATYEIDNQYSSSEIINSNSGDT